MKKTTIVITILALMIIIGVITFWPKQEQEISETTKHEEIVRVGYRTHNLYLPLFIGLDQGYFEKNGLKIEPIKFESTNQLMESLIAGRIDAALGGINTFLLLTIEEKSSNEFKIFSVVQETPEIPITHLLVRADSDIESIDELKGKKIGIHPGSSAQLLYRKIFADYFKPEEATLLQMSPDLELAALESGQVDAIIALEPLASIGFTKGFVKSIESALVSQYLVDRLYLATSIVSTKFLKEDQSLAKKFIQATNEALGFINNNPNEARKSLVKYTPLEKEVVDRIVLPRYLTLEEIDNSKLQEVADFLFVEGEINSEINVSAMLLKE